MPSERSHLVGPQEEHKLHLPPIAMPKIHYPVAGSVE